MFLEANRLYREFIGNEFMTAQSDYNRNIAQQVRYGWSDYFDGIDWAGGLGMRVGEFLTENPDVVNKIKSRASSASDSIFNNPYIVIIYYATISYPNLIKIVNWGIREGDLKLIFHDLKLEY